MTSVIYAPADSRGWGLGNSSLRNTYLIGGALQPSDIYTVRVREHWRRARKKATVTPAAVVVAPTPRRRRPPKRAPAPIRVLRSSTRRAPAVAVPVPVVPAAPAAPNTTLAVPVPPTKRRRIN